MMVSLAMSQMQTLAVVFMASLWASAVHCHVLGQVNNGDDSQTSQDTNAAVLCPEDHFFNTTQGNCARCSQCPMNRVILSPCQGFRDTRCGPFVLFHNFGAPNNGQGDEKVTDEKMESKNNLDGIKSSLRHSRNKSTVVTSEDKSFTLTLIIILGVVLAIFFLVVSITCYVRHKSSRSTKEVQCEYKPAPVPVSV